MRMKRMLEKLFLINLRAYDYMRKELTWGNEGDDTSRYVGDTSWRACRLEAQYCTYTSSSAVSASSEDIIPNLYPRLGAKL
jgi:hypothetical protein